ncbi:unnamed protein product [Musa textilis]
MIGFIRGVFSGHYFCNEVHKGCTLLKSATVEELEGYTMCRWQICRYRLRVLRREGREAPPVMIQVSSCIFGGKILIKVMRMREREREVMFWDCNFHFGCRSVGYYTFP